jgi:hypothetical protein
VLNNRLQNVQSVTSNPIQNWPPNNKSATDPDSVSDIKRITYSVNDEYGKFNVAEANLPQSGIVSLIADRNGDDKDGRIYKVTLTVYDKGGLSATTNVNVVFPMIKANKN